MSKPNIKSMEREEKRNEGIEESCQKSGIRNQWIGKGKGMRGLKRAVKEDEYGINGEGKKRHMRGLRRAVKGAE